MLCVNAHQLNNVKVDIAKHMLCHRFLCGEQILHYCRGAATVVIRRYPSADSYVAREGALDDVSPSVAALDTMPCIIHCVIWFVKDIIIENEKCKLNVKLDCERWLIWCGWRALVIHYYRTDLWSELHRLEFIILHQNWIVPRRIVERIYIWHITITHVVHAVRLLYSRREHWNRVRVSVNFSRIMRTIFQLFQCLHLNGNTLISLPNNQRLLS